MLNSDGPEQGKTHPRLGSLYSMCMVPLGLLEGVGVLWAYYHTLVQISHVDINILKDCPWGVYTCVDI